MLFAPHIDQTRPALYAAGMSRKLNVPGKRTTRRACTGRAAGGRQPFLGAFDYSEDGLTGIDAIFAKSGKVIVGLTVREILDE